MRNRFDNLTIEPGYIVISGLQSGWFFLGFKGDQSSFKIRVHRNSIPWGHSSSSSAVSLIAQEKLFLDLAESSVEMHPRIENVEQKDDKISI